MNWAPRKVLEEAMDCLATRSRIPPNSLPTTGSNYRGLQTVGQGQTHSAASVAPGSHARFAHGNICSLCDNSTRPVNSPEEKCPPQERTLFLSRVCTAKKNVLWHFVNENIVNTCFLSCYVNSYIISPPLACWPTKPKLLTISPQSNLPG